MSLTVPLRKKKTTHLVPIFPSNDLIQLLPGEIMVAQATKVQQLLYFSERSGCPGSSISGTLVCTNYCISFVPTAGSVEKLPDKSAQCLLNASRHIPLGCVEQVNILSSKTKKVLDGVSTLPKHLGHLQLLCKDVRKLNFSLKGTSKNEATSLLNAIGRHSHPNSVHLLFAFDYTRAVKDSHRHDHFSSADTPPILSYLNPRDWQRELLRLGITNDQWKVSEANKHFLVCSSLCPFFPCPTSFCDPSIESAAGVHSNNRLPVWCWSHPRTGVSLTRGGIILVDDELEAPDPNYRVSVTMARHTEQQVENKGLKIINILQKCGSIKNLHYAFRKLRELCTPGSTVELSSIDKHWFGGLESSGWLAMVHSCLVAAKEVTHLLCIKRHCAMLLEDSGCDLSCVVSSLVELMADPHYRSISGFENLVQKEWVALGHPFTTRHGLVVDAAEEEDHQEAPVFLLFLDCVWQLSRQFPSAFEFSEFFLLRFYDMVLGCLYNNFLFNSPKQRLQASLHSRHSCFFGTGDEPLEAVDDYEGPLLSAWSHWREAMSKEDHEKCLNPLYYIFGSGDSDYENGDSTPLNTQFGSILNDSTHLTGFYSDREVTPVSTSSQDVDYYRQGLLVPETSLCSLKVWDGFFFRYVPELGMCHQQEQLEVQQLESRMVRDVQKLKEELNEMELSLGAFTTDLPSCIGEAVLARKRELMVERRESLDVGVPLRPRLTASMYSYSGIDSLGEEYNFLEEDGTEDQKEDISNDATPVNSPLRTATKEQQKPTNGNLEVKLSAVKQTSLAQFTDALYSSEIEDGAIRPRALVEMSTSSVSTGSNRSPVTKTRLRVVKSQTSDPVIAAWQSSPRQAIRHSQKELHKQRSIEEPNAPALSSASQLTEL